MVILSDGGGRHPINKNLEEFDALAEKGVGLVCVHYAVEVPKGAPGDMLKKWLGGYFEVFWSVNPHWTADFKTLPKHPITRGVQPFSLKDEWYYHMKFRDRMEGVTPILSALPPADTLKRGDGPHSNNPHVKKISSGKKRKTACRMGLGKAERAAWVLVVTGAHHHKSWDNDDFRTCVLNAIIWTAKMEVPQERRTSQSSNPTIQSKEGTDGSSPTATSRGSKECSFYQ